MKRNNKTLAKIKRGFTLVELVIVIAVIAILAAVLIPTFITVIDNANNSADVQLVANMNTILSTDLDIKENATAENLRKVLNENGLAGTDLATKNDDMLIVYNQKTNKFERMNLKKTLGGDEIVIANAADGSSYFAVNPYAPEEIFTDRIIVSTGGNALSEALYKLHNIENKDAVAENADILKSVDKGIRDKLQPIINSTLYVGKNAEDEAAEMFRMAMSDEGKLSVSDATAQSISRVAFHEECTELDLKALSDNIQGADVFAVLPETLETVADTEPTEDGIKNTTFLGNTELIQEKVSQDRIQDKSVSEMRDIFEQFEDEKDAKLRSLATHSDFSLVGKDATVDDYSSTSLVELMDLINKLQTYNNTAKTVTVKCDYELTSDITIPANVTLLLPYSDNDKTGYNDKYDSTWPTSEQPQLYRTLTIREGVTINNNGKLIIGALTGAAANGTHPQGKIAGGYSKIVLSGKIISSGELLAYGNIEGSGTVEVLSGTVKERLEINDWQGGSMSGGRFTGEYTVSIFGFGAITIEDPKEFPFKDYSVNGIGTNLIVHYGATYATFAKIFTGAVSVSIMTIPAQFNCVDFVIVGRDTSNGLFVLNEGAFLTKSFDKENDRTKITVSGGASLGQAKFEMNVFKDITIGSGVVMFPVTGGLDIIFENGEYTAQYGYKILPDGAVYLKNNATLTLNNSTRGTVVYEGTDIHAHENQMYATDLPDGKIVVGNGCTLKINGKFGGKISGEEGATVVIGDSAALTATTEESYGARNSLTFNYTVINTITHAATFESSETAIEDGATYKFQDGTWQKQS